MTDKYFKGYRASVNEVPKPRAKRSLGQNFLQDANIARKIVAALRIQTSDRVLEIGPGPGALTGCIMAAEPAQLLLVEKDAHWARERMKAGRGRLSVILADALRMPWERFLEPWKFIGNLPYNVASPLMWDLFSRAQGLERAVFMVQKEVGLRLTAKVGTAAYGALSVWVQSHTRPRLEFIVPPHVFRPKPKVDSAVLSFMPLGGEAQERAEIERPFDAALLAATLKACFQMRRKQLGSIARAAGKEAGALAEIGFDPRLRPEQLTPKDFQILSEARIFTGNH